MSENYSKINPHPPISLNDEHSELTANALKAMAHPVRWKILCALGSKGEMSVGEIIEAVASGNSQSNFSQHLEQMKNRQIITSRKEANRVYYKIYNGKVDELITIMRKVLCPSGIETDKD